MILVAIFQCTKHITSEKNVPNNKKIHTKMLEMMKGFSGSKIQRAPKRLEVIEVTLRLNLKILTGIYVFLSVFESNSISARKQSDYTLLVHWIHTSNFFLFLANCDNSAKSYHDYKRQERLESARYTTRSGQKRDQWKVYIEKKRNALSLFKMISASVVSILHQ